MSRSPRDISTIQREIDDFRHRVSLLQEHADRYVGDQSTAVAALIEELHVAVAELLTNEEEFRLKQEQWAEIEARLRHERQRYEHLFDHAPDPYLVTNPTGIIEHANVPASIFLRQSKSSITGKPLLVFVDDTHKRRYLDRLAHLKSPRWRDIRNWELLMRPAEGASVSASVNITAQQDSHQHVVSLRWSIREIPLGSMPLSLPS